MIDARAAILLVLDAVLLGVMVLWPLPRRFDDSDQGTGNLVILPPPKAPSLARCGAFVAVCFIACAGVVGVRNPSLLGIYQHYVKGLANSVLHQPLVVERATKSLVPVVPISVVAFGVALAAVFDSSWGRRLTILLNVLLFLAVSVVTDALLCVFLVGAGLPLGPTPVVSVLIHYALTFPLIFRVSFTSFQLPRLSQVPLRRKSDLPYDAVLIFCLVAAFGVVASGAVFLVKALGQHHAPLTMVVVLAIPSYTFVTMYALLGILRLLGPPNPRPGPVRPPLDVIIPAYNEELNIIYLLASLDRAARRYEGPVRIVLCDDGSSDATRELAAEAMARFRAATGEIINGSHRGKAGALNQALALCTAEYVYRVDADCTVDEWCFVYSVPWFLHNPRVGLVGAFTLPKEPYTSWIDRMRLFELLFAFGFTRVCGAVVDAIPCIPGTFTGFRRAPALEIGGFVEGMFGEDVDFTCSIARLGYTAAIDRRVISYEDVPNTLRQLRIQRTRWNRGGTMTFARFSPFGLRGAGPRFWFSTTRAGGKRLVSPLHLAALTFAIAVAVFHPTAQRNLARVGVFVVVAQVPNLALKVVMGVYYKRARYLPWLLLWYVFSLAKRLFALEAFLSFRARPVLTPRLRTALRPSGGDDGGEGVLERPPSPALT
jgi:cellulose synthase/poly-beta-1,6-N-acetylglucosamine synthase-like glycosyltransferase